jgi:aspartyl/asparaginyl beta-hydroxylase (cupin superfamily)
MNPGVEITPHRGYRDFADKVYRAHLCIKEAPNCLLRVGEKEYTWEKGKAFYFDDSLEHSAYNRSMETRIIMLFDIARDPNNIPELTENMMQDFA